MVGLRALRNFTGSPCPSSLFEVADRGMDMSVAILAAVEKFVRTVRDCLPIDDAPHGEAVAATEMTHAYSGDYCAQRQSHQATFDELLQDPPTDQRPDQAIRLYPEIVPVERDLRALCRLVQGERSKRWEHLQLLLEELQGRAVYSWTWDGYSPLRTGSRGPHH